jgi:hypothetical protein
VEAASEANRNPAGVHPSLTLGLRQLLRRRRALVIFREVRVLSDDARAIRTPTTDYMSLKRWRNLRAHPPKDRGVSFSPGI